ncbi:hypothetical protein BDZ91DRAFT_779069 [Kalaharituber pfeilii]|nr:hypothetical protein BDZ91DRAFT_779069 [Kalaharituber pfeilii]
MGQALSISVPSRQHSKKYKPKEWKPKKAREARRRAAIAAEGKVVQEVMKVEGGKGKVVTGSTGVSSSSSAETIAEKEGDGDKDVQAIVSLDPQLSHTWSQTLLSSPRNRLALSALTSHSINDIALSPAAPRTYAPIFSHVLSLEGTPVTHQRATGRCWLFAATNVLRLPLMKKLKLSSFEFSQSYLFFWDKYEKANFFLEKIVEVPLDGEGELEGRLVQWLLGSPVGDGGQWDMFVNVVEKYGLVPGTVYAETTAAKMSGRLNWLVTRKLREAALRIREIRRKDGSTKSARSRELIEYKNSVLQSIHTILVLMLGPPPSPNEEFSWQYTDSTGAVQSLTSTPIRFYRQTVAFPALDYFSLVNDPRNEYGSVLKVEHLGNVVGEIGRVGGDGDDGDGKSGKEIPARETRYLNVDVETMKRVVIRMIKEGEAVFFGCDVGKFAETAAGKGWLACGDGNKGVWDLELVLGVEGFVDGPVLEGDHNGTGMSKKERLMTRESLMTHAMVFTGVHLDESTGRPVRWRVENSWGAESGGKGYLVMGDEWFGEYVMQVVTRRDYVKGEEGVEEYLLSTYKCAEWNEHGLSVELQRTPTLEIA